MVSRSHNTLPTLPMIGRFEDCNKTSKNLSKEETESLLYHEAVDEEKLTSPSIVARSSEDKRYTTDKGYK